MPPATRLNETNNLEIIEMWHNLIAILLRATYLPTLKPTLTKKVRERREMAGELTLPFIHESEVHLLIVGMVPASCCLCCVSLLCPGSSSIIMLFISRVAHLIRHLAC